MVDVDGSILATATSRAAAITGDCDLACCGLDRIPSKEKAGHFFGLFDCIY